MLPSLLPAHVLPFITHVLPLISHILLLIAHVLAPSVEGYCFLKYIMIFGRDSIINRPGLPVPWATDKWQGYLPGTYMVYWSQTWYPRQHGKEATFSCGSFGIRHLWLMNGGWALYLPSFLNNVFLNLLSEHWWIGQIQNYGIASKPEKHGDGRHSSCMDYVRLEPVSTVVLIGNKLSSKRGFLRSLSRKARFGTFGWFGLNATIGVQPWKMARVQS